MNINVVIPVFNRLKETQKIIEDLSVELENGSEVLETEDTMTLLDKYIDDIDLKVNVNNVKNIMRSLYIEACEI